MPEYLGAKRFGCKIKRGLYENNKIKFKKSDKALMAQIELVFSFNADYNIFKDMGQHNRTVFPKARKKQERASQAASF